MPARPNENEDAAGDEQPDPVGRPGFRREAHASTLGGGSVEITRLTTGEGEY
jgi:hypothetical protein